METIKQQNFKRIAENRVNKIVESISKLHNLSNSSFYEYTEEQIDKMFDVIQKELNRQKEEFKKKGKNKKIEL